MTELRGDLDIWQAAKLRLEAEVSEAEAQVEAEESAFLSEVQTRISKVNAEMSVVQESLRGADDRVRRAMLKSPVGGVVNKVNVATIGEVIAAGASIVEIVPVDDKLLDRNAHPAAGRGLHPSGRQGHCAPQRLRLHEIRHAFRRGRAHRRRHDHRRERRNLLPGDRQHGFGRLARFRTRCASFPEWSPLSTFRTASERCSNIC